jgi:hypothetical protein
MANAFQAMLNQFGLTEKILAVNADNATSNDTQTRKLHQLDNSFDDSNRVRCFNHTLQLSAKSLLTPFNTALSGKPADEDDVTALYSDNDEMIPQDDDDAILGDDEEEEGEENDLEDDVEDDNVDELEALSEEERDRVVNETTIIRAAVTKVTTTKQKMFAFSNTNMFAYLQVRQLSFAIINSTTIALPAWRRICRELELKERLIPRDVVTRWNSTYDMLRFVLTYRTAIDKITADKSLKLRRYELDNDDWVIIEELVCVLEVSHQANSDMFSLTILIRHTRKPLSFSHKIRPASQL